jgi:hypothetical protein
MLTQLPYPPTNDNREWLELWIKEYYGDSTFNTCEHQQLPLLEGPPVWIRVVANTTPVAVHTPIAVPLHWQEKVKSNLDRDVTLGIIEPVPVGELLTWCSRMVISRKKNGHPCCCVDYQ